MVVRFNKNYSVEEYTHNIPSGFFFLPRGDMTSTAGEHDNTAESSCRTNLTEELGIVYVGGREAFLYKVRTSPLCIIVIIFICCTGQIL